ncbi:MAG TPA: HisA/HisF-related TIM barrel protein [Pirellulales bacterium]|nr:HisA/HisF-related TIM barrel protein [Pirellulales bacterium]
MQILPVIDLMGGLVVRGVGGRRHEYRPIESRLCSGAKPGAVARALREQFAIDEIYVAELDAIAGAEPAWDILRELAGCGLSLRVDAGITTLERARRLAEFRADGKPLSAVIAGLESLASPDALKEMLAAVGPERLVFSLDLKAEVPLVAASAWRGLDAFRIASAALKLGVRRLIVLDLARVGMSAGAGTEGICRRLRQLDSGVEIVAGGGVRGVEDLESLAAAGCDGVLIASALHDGRLTPAQLRDFASRAATATSARASR